ncbi:unnamed protein product [Rotaria magnacalcarata]|uniref:HAT C-terminal dimerisation domain-containing protein n=1 Tax=Rotaria magnacalcarata TaxID=392030 RepID=A0A8S2T9A4_9BILA|nr:unnamed protein product [Rotaria magnacalcarata]
MIRVGRAIPKLLSNAEIDRIHHEFMIFGLPKYPTLSKIVKNILIISHGNSDVERGFSINEHIITENRTLLSLSSINGLRSTWDAIKFYGAGSPHRVPIKIDMIRAVQKSKSVYNQEQLSLKSLADREKEQSEKHEHTNEEMKKLIDRENQLLSKQKGLHDKQKKAQLLVGESRQRLDNALKKADIINAQAANALIGAGDEQGKLISDELFKITDELSKIQKTSLLTLPWCSSIKCLIVDGDFSFESLNCLFRYLPQLHRLSINFLKKINNIEMDKNLSMIQLKHLKYVSLKMSAFIPFDWFKVLTKTFFRHLQTLRLTARVGEEY